MENGACDASSHETLPLATTRWGDGEPRLVLIHGVGDGAFVWDAFIGCLSPRDSGIAVDLRGHGDSPHDPLQRYGADVLAADLIEIIDTVGTRDLVLVGHSLGAEIAARVAAARPSRVSGLILVDGGPELNARAAEVVREQLNVQAWRYQSAVELELLLAERHPLAESDTLRHYVARALRRTADGSYVLKLDPGLARGLKPPDRAAIWAALQAVTCPILLVRGALSAVLSHHQLNEVARRLRDCRIGRVPKAGHAVALENPRGLHAVVRPFLLELGFEA